MIVVSNTSPLTNLAAIGQADLLPRLFQTILIPTGVWRELQAPERTWPGKTTLATATWLEKQDVQNQALVTVLQRDLDLGESESIALALELQADFILLDEREGRRAAQRLGLNIIGVLGVLLEAKKRGYVTAVHPLMDALRQTAGFYLSNAVYRHVLDLAGE